MIVTKDKKIDRRIVRTRLAIRDALVALIKEKGFDALTVRDIVARADINRGTFYLHYKDKFELLDQTETEILEGIQHIFLQASLLDAGSVNKTEDFQQLLIILLEYVKDHAKLIHAILGLQGDYSFIARIRSMVEKNLKLGALSGLNEENFLVPREYLIAYVFHAHLGVLQSWLAAGCKETPQEMARIFFQLSFEGPMHATGLDINQD